MKMHKTIGMLLAVTFAIVGLIFLFIPGQVITFFNNLSPIFGMPSTPPFESGLYHILAAAYMYVVTLLAFFMWRRPTDGLAPLLLANAKLASAALSLGAFLAGNGYLIFLANAVVDGFLGIVVLILYLRLSKGAGNIHLAFLNMYMPQTIRREKLSELAALTARAFELTAPDIKRLSSDEALREYALFTASAAGDAIKGQGSIEGIQQRLFNNAREFGRGLRRQLHIGSDDQFALACEILYRAIGIDCQCKSDGSFVANSCFFADYYSPETCQVISSLDAGLMAGLSDGARLSFSQRITEGYSCCKANLTFADTRL